MAWVLHILLVATLMRFARGTAFGVYEMVDTRPILEGIMAVPMEVSMPWHLKMMTDQAKMVLETITTQMDDQKSHHAMKLEYEIFMNRKVSLNISLVHLSNNLLEGIYHPMENRTKRALLDIGGKLLQGVFGVATEIDLDMLRVRFDNSTRKLISSQNKIVIMTNVLKDSILNLSNAMIVQNELLHEFKKKTISS